MSRITESGHEKPGVTEQRGRAPLRLEVTDFGPIGKAVLDLRPLSVFIGPSNTGKSCLARLIYALHQYLGRGGLARSIHARARSLLANGESESKAVQDAREGMTKLVEVYTEFEAEPSSDLILPAAVASLIQQALYEVDGDDFGYEITRCFGLEAAALIRKNASGRADIVIRTPCAGLSRPLEHQWELGAKGAEFKPAKTIPMKLKGLEAWIRAHEMSRTFHRISPMQQNSIPREMGFSLLHDLSEEMLANVYSYFASPAYYLPADRAGACIQSDSRRSF